MPNAETAELQLLIDRLRQGDESAREQLINRAYTRLCGLAARLLGQDFSRLRLGPAIQHTSDIANEVSLRLYQALAEVQPPTVRDFLGLAAQRMRWILLDLAKKHGVEQTMRGLLPEEIAWPTPPKSEIASDELTRLHELVDQLPTEEREVVDRLFYLGMSAAEAAEDLGVTAKTIQRRWVKARIKLGTALRPHLVPKEP
jgi:RNA polymerase sigma-70 factor (ECF subfamily)